MKIYPNTIAFFGQDDIYSNFYYSPFVYDGILVPSSEHAFMLEKARYFEDDKTGQKIVEACNKELHPKEVKKLGRQVKSFDAEEWEEVKVGIMYYILKCKFSLPELRDKFLEDGKGRKFVEASPWDKSWGVGLREDDPSVCNCSSHRGSNLLGRALDRLWKELDEGNKSEQN